MIVSTSSFRKPVNPTTFTKSLQEVNLIRLILLLVILATPVGLSLLPNQVEANYFLSAQVGDPSYGLPTYCESGTSTLIQCTPIGTLPLYSETSSFSVTAKVMLLHGSRESLECSGGLNTFYCGHSLTQLSSIANP